MSHLIERQIHAIARRARRLLVVHGLCWFVAVVVAVALVLGGIDYSLRLQDRGVRIILSLAFGLALLGSFRRFVVPALRRRFSDLEVAQQVERRFPQLGDQLSSSLEFLRDGQAANQAESATLQQTVISETEALVRPLQLADCLDARATRRSLLACLPLLLIIGVVCVVDLEATALAARRLAVPWSRESWPRWHSLEFVKPPHRIALGHDFAVEVIDRRGRLPQDVKLQFWFDGEDQDAVEAAAMQRSEDRFRYTRGNVTRSFKYRAIGGDDSSMDWHSLEVVEPARITDLRVAVESPAYSGIAPAVLTSGPIRILEGTHLAISGRTTRPVQHVRAVIEIGDAVEVVEADVDHHDSTFAISSLPTETLGKGEYWIELIEADGVVSGGDTRARWEVVADQVPTVTVSAPTSDMYFTPDAIVPIRVNAADDLAIQRLLLQIGTTTIPLFVGADAPRPLDELPSQPDVREITHELNLREFQLAAHDSLKLVFTASDYRPQTSDPVVRSMTIISREDFDDRLQDKQKLLLQRLVEALRLHRATRAQVASLQAQLKAVGDLSEDDASLLRASELQQQQVARLLDDRPGGAAQLVADLLAALNSNQLSGSDAASRMERISNTLAVINRERLPDLQSELVRATKSVRLSNDAGDDIPALLASAADRQDAIAADLQSMIDQLGQWEDYRRFRQDVATLLRDQRELGTRLGQLPTIGQRFDTLSTQQRADLERAAGEQLELARRFDRLRSEMDQLRARISESDPTAAATLSKALHEAGTSGIAEQMRGIGNDVARNRLGNAAQAQPGVEQGLQQVLGALTESNRSGEDGNEAPGSEQLAAALARLKAELADVTSRQQVLLDATSEWQAKGAAALTPTGMAREQQQLVDDAREARGQLSLPGVLAFGMKSAEETMKQAAARLQQETPDAQLHRLQSRALSRLQQLLAALDSHTPGDQSDAAREQSPAGGDDSTPASSTDQRASLSLEELRLLHALQLDLYERTVALEQQRQARGTLESEEQRELQQLATEQGQLAELLTEAMAAGQQDDMPRPKPPASSSELDNDLDRALEQIGIPGFGGDE
jgi:hypothetical protein